MAAPRPIVIAQNKKKEEDQQLLTPKFNEEELLPAKPLANFNLEVEDEEDQMEEDPSALKRSDTCASLSENAQKAIPTTEPAHPRTKRQQKPASLKVGLKAPKGEGGASKHTKPRAPSGFDGSKRDKSGIFWFPLFTAASFQQPAKTLDLKEIPFIEKTEEMTQDDWESLNTHKFPRWNKFINKFGSTSIKLFPSDGIDISYWGDAQIRGLLLDPIKQATFPMDKYGLIVRKTAENEKVLGFYPK